jgi:hypothetical protein
MDLVLQSHIESIDFGMLELPSGNPSLKQDIKLFHQLGHKMRMTGRLTSAKVRPAGSGSRK